MSRILLLLALVCALALCTDCEKPVSLGEYGYCNDLGSVDCEEDPEEICCPVGTKCYCNSDLFDALLNGIVECKVPKGAKIGFSFLVGVGALGTIVCLPCIAIMILLVIVLFPCAPCWAVLCCPCWIWLAMLIIGAVAILVRRRVG